MPPAHTPIHGKRPVKGHGKACAIRTVSSQRTELNFSSLGTIATGLFQLAVAAAYSNRRLFLKQAAADLICQQAKLTLRQIRQSAATLDSLGLEKIRISCF